VYPTLGLPTKGYSKFVLGMIFGTFLINIFVIFLYWINQELFISITSEKIIFSFFVLINCLLYTSYVIRKASKIRFNRYFSDFIPLTSFWSIILYLDLLFTIFITCLGLLIQFIFGIRRIHAITFNFNKMIIIALTIYFLSSNVFDFDLTRLTHISIYGIIISLIAWLVNSLAIVVIMTVTTKESLFFYMKKIMYDFQQIYDLFIKMSSVIIFLSMNYSFLIFGIFLVLLEFLIASYHLKTIETQIYEHEIRENQIREEEDYLHRKLLEESINRTALIAHDFNNFLQKIKMNLEFLELELNQDGLDKYIHNIHETLGESARLVKDLGMLKRDNSMEKNLETIDLKQLIENIVLKYPRIKSQFLLNLEKNIFLEFNELALKRVFDNLIKNSIETNTDNIIISITTDKTSLDNELPGLKSGDYVEILFADNGPGIPEKIAPYIFMPYISTKERKSGLGLSSVFQIIQSHKGMIKLQNQNPGAIFQILLPISQN
jgi:signal transduction histidine kinase